MQKKTAAIKERGRKLFVSHAHKQQLTATSCLMRPISPLSPPRASNCLPQRICKPPNRTLVTLGSDRHFSNMSLLLLAAIAMVPNGQTFPCTPTRVWDGDGPIWCAEGPRIRLSGIAAREMDESCAISHPCPSASAVEARDALVRFIGRPTGTSPEGHVMISGQTMQCRSVGSAGGSRTAAWCISPQGGDLSCAMVRGGWAARWDRYWRDHRC